MNSHTAVEDGALGTRARLTLAVAWLALAWYATSYPLNHDVGWLLYISRSMLRGETLYVDLIEINPPLYAYLTMLPVLVANGLGVSIVVVTKALILATCVALGVWSTLLVTAGKGGFVRWLVALALAIALLGLPGADFGQREHLMFALVTPYLVSTAGRLGGVRFGGRTPLLAGLAAGVGFALKPHFLLAWIAVELLVVAEWRSIGRWLRRGELHGVLASFAVYAAVILAAHPHYLEFAWNARHLYAEFAARDRSTLLLHPFGFVVVAAFVALVTFRPRDAELAALARVFLTLAVGTWIAALVQGKGWSYHYYPSLAAGTVAGMVLLGGFLRAIQRTRAAPNVGDALVAAFLVAMLCLVPAWLIGDHREVMGIRAARLTAQRDWIVANGVRSLTILSPAVPGSFPLVNYAGVEWGSPHPSMWWIQAAHGGHRGAGLAEDVPPLVKDSIEGVFLRRLVDKMASVRPDAVLVDTAASERFGGASFPYIGYLSHDPAFRELWREYGRAGELGRYAVYRRRWVRDLRGCAR